MRQAVFFGVIPVLASPRRRVGWWSPHSVRCGLAIGPQTAGEGDHNSKSKKCRNLIKH